MRADLHIHTHYSDGLMPPKMVAELAKSNGVRLISITDHDTILGVEEGRAACAELGINCAVGIEVSAYKDDIKIHTLGYGFDLEHPEIKALLFKLYSSSVKRADDILSKLQKVGVKLRLEEIYSQLCSPDIPVHAMHIARAAVKKGYGSNEFSFYLQHLAWGGDSYSNVERPNPEEVCEIIRSAGGITSLAHPGRIDLDKADKEKLIRRLIGSGLNCIESVYSGHTIEETEYYTSLAKELGLRVTGGSDTHTATGRRQIGEPKFDADYELTKLLKIDQ